MSHSLLTTFFLLKSDVTFIVLFIASQARARQLLKAGYKTLSSLAWADASLLVTQIEHLSKRQAHQIVSAAKVKPLYLNV